MNKDLLGLILTVVVVVVIGFFYQDKIYNEVGMTYSHGRHGFDINQNEAFKWFMRAAKNGDARGQYNVGIHYTNGQGVEKDLGEANNWFAKSAEQGFSLALYNLGVNTIQGNGIQQDTALAKVLLKEAADNHLPQALDALGTLYLSGDVCDKCDGSGDDAIKGLEYLVEAANSGYELAIQHVMAGYMAKTAVIPDEDDLVQIYYWICVYKRISNKPGVQLMHDGLKNQYSQIFPQSLINSIEKQAALWKPVSKWQKEW